MGRRAQSVNELQRTLESTNIKLGNVVTDVTGVSATEMLQGILAGQTDPTVLAEMARGTSPTRCTLRSPRPLRDPFFLAQSRRDRRDSALSRNYYERRLAERAAQ